MAPIGVSWEFVQMFKAKVLTVEKSHDNDILKEGYLHKEGAFHKSWKKRWFTLTYTHLEYATEKGKSPKGRIRLSEFMQPIPGDNPKQFQLMPDVVGDTLRLGSAMPKKIGRVYKIEADSKEEKLSWVEAINKARAGFSLKTEEANEEIVLPACKDRECSYIELFEGGNLDQGKTSLPLFADATVFVSHAWKQPISLAIEVMESYFNAEEGPVYFWFDLFVNNQFNTDDRDFKWWFNRFRSSIHEIGKVMLVLSPWNSPVSLKRIWCLCELWCGTDDGVELLPRIPKSEHPDFFQQLCRNDTRSSDHTTSLFDMFGRKEELPELLKLITIDLKNAEATNKDDKDKISEAVEKDLGFEALDAKLTRELPGMLIEAGRAGVKDFKPTHDALAKALRSGKSCVEGDVTYPAICHHLGNLCQEFNRDEPQLRLQELAEQFREMCITSAMERGDDRLANIYKVSHASTLIRHGKTKQAFQSLKELGAIFEKSLPQTAYGGFCRFVGFEFYQAKDFSSAIKFFEKSVTSYLLAKQPKSQGSVDSYFGLAAAYLRKGKPQFALESFEHCIPRQAEAPQGVERYLAMAAEVFRGDISSFVKHCKDVITITDRLFGEHNLATAAAYHMIVKELEQMEERPWKKLIKYAEKKLTILLKETPKDSSIFFTYRQLAMYYLNTDKEAAKECVINCKKGWKELAEADHMIGMLAASIL